MPATPVGLRDRAIILTLVFTGRRRAVGKIQLPDFQRGWIWDDDRIKGLLASISRGFPVGAIMTLSAGGDIRFKTRLVEGVSDNGLSPPDRFLLDGQQRLTSLYQALLHPGPVTTENSRGEKRPTWFYIERQPWTFPGRNSSTESSCSLIAQANFIPERLLTLSTRNSAAYKGLYALQMKNGATDWRSNVTLSLATYNNENIDIHHVFPVAWCQSTEGKPAISRLLYDSVINKTPLSAATNRIIGGRGPAVYLKRLEEDMGTARLEQALEAHWLNPVYLRANSFQDSFVERGETLLRLIGQAMGRELGSGRDVFRGALSSAGYSESFQEEEPEYDALGDGAANEEGTTAA